MNLHHIARQKRTPPDNHPGGVPLFGDYLRRVFGATLWSWSDYPNRGAVDEPKAALLLGAWLDTNYKMDGGPVIVVDGFWGRGLPTLDPNFRPRTIITVAHGTWRGIARAFNSAQAAHLGDIQAVEYMRLPVVAVSEASAQELRELYGVEPAAVIRNGVDTDEFCPREKSPRSRPIIIYPSDAKPKGGDIVAALRARCPQWEFRRIGAEIGQEAEAIAQGDVYLHPSRYEGCSFAVLQALACGLPVVGTPVGILQHSRSGADWTEAVLDSFVVGATVRLEAAIGAWAEAIGKALAVDTLARAWAVEHGSLARWEREWRALLESVM